MGLHVTEYEKFTVMVSHSTLQLKKLSLVKFWNSRKEKYVQLSEKGYYSLFQIHICARPDFLHMLRSKHCIRLDTKAFMRSQLHTIKPDIKEI